LFDSLFSLFGDGDFSVSVRLGGSITDGGDDEGVDKFEVEEWVVVWKASGVGGGMVVR
jgi:hypothetical protein